MNTKEIKKVDMGGRPTHRLIKRYQSTNSWLETFPKKLEFPLKQIMSRSL